MDSSRHHTAPGLARRIREEGHLFDFFHLVHLIELCLTSADAPVGGSGPARSEMISFQPNPALAFPPADIDKVIGPSAERVERSPPWKVIVNFMGLYGVSSPTPLYLSELIATGVEGSEDLKDFLDIYNHRLISFFYRAGTKNRYAYQYRPGAVDTISRCIFSVAGFSGPRSLDSLGLSPEHLLRYAGLFSMSARPRLALQSLLGDYFSGADVEVEEFVHRKVRIPEKQRCHLGQANSRLGLDLCIGNSVSDISGKFRLKIGPLGFPQFFEFLPGGRAFSDACSLAHLWVSGRLVFDLKLVMKGGEIGPACLGGPNGSRLGWTSWLAPVGGLEQDPAVVLDIRSGLN